MVTGGVDIQGITMLTDTFGHAKIRGMGTVFLAAFKIIINVHVQRGYVKATLWEILLINYMCSIFSSLFIMKDQIISMKFHVGIQVISLELMHLSSHGV
jgi:hypothetical protein